MTLTLSFENLQPAETAPALQLTLQAQQQAVLAMPDEGSQEALVSVLKGQSTPVAGSVQLPENNQHHIVLPGDEEEEEDRKLKAVLTAPFQRLLTSLRKYEQLSIQVSKHFSPMQLGGYMEEMEELEQLINQYEAWDLEANLKTWQAGLQLPDLSIPYDDATTQQQWAVLLTRAFVLPASLTIFPDPTPWLNEEQQDFLIHQLTLLSSSWLVVSTTGQAQAWPEAYRAFP